LGIRCREPSADTGPETGRDQHWVVWAQSWLDYFQGSGSRCSIRKTVTSSLAAHFPTLWEPVYASSKWAINCFVQTVRRQVFKHGIRVGSVSPGPVISALLADWPPEKLKEARESGSLLEASEVANVVMFMLTRPRGMTIRDVVMLPTNFDL
jgi:ribitol 2-dehydrogenase